MKRPILLLLALTLVLLACSAMAEEPKNRADVDGEFEITLEEAPEAVQQTILREAGEHELLGVDMIRKGPELFFEAEWLEEGMEVEIKVSPAGEVLAREVEAPDSDDED